MLDLHSIFKNGDQTKRVLDSPTHAHRIRNVCTRTELGNTETSIMLSLARASQAQDFSLHFRPVGFTLQASFFSFVIAMVPCFTLAMFLAQAIGLHPDMEVVIGLRCILISMSTLHDMCLLAALYLKGYLDPVTTIIEKWEASGPENENIWKQFSRLSSANLFDERLDPLVAYLQSGVAAGGGALSMMTPPSPVRLWRQWARRDARSRRRVLTDPTMAAKFGKAKAEKTWQRPGGKSRTQRLWQREFQAAAPIRRGSSAAYRTLFLGQH